MYLHVWKEQGTSFKVMGNYIGSGLTNYSAQEIQGSEHFLYCHGFLIIVTHDILYYLKMIWNFCISFGIFFQIYPRE